MRLPMAEWLIVALEPGVHWPNTETTIRFRGLDLVLRPETAEHSPNIAVSYAPPTTGAEVHHIVRQFLSSLAWAQSLRLREAFTFGGGLPFQAGKGKIDLGAKPFLEPRFETDYVPDPPDPRARRALAIYREALGLNSVPYQILGFHKILNVVHASPNAQIEWTNRVVGSLEDYFARARVEELRQQGEDIGVYLYASGRCAVAHAYAQPVVDPDRPEDTLRLQRDLSLMKALAEFSIEYELGVKSERTVWREHLYELDGFRALLGGRVVEALKARHEVPLERLPVFPELSIRLRYRPNFPAFENLRPVVGGATDGRLLIRCSADDGLVEVLVVLDFADERLKFDPIDGVAVQDDGSSKAIRYALDQLRCVEQLYANGCIELWDARENRLLGRCDAFVPENIDFHALDEWAERTRKQLEAEADRRVSVSR